MEVDGPDQDGWGRLPKKSSKEEEKTMTEEKVTTAGEEKTTKGDKNETQTEKGEGKTGEKLTPRKRGNQESETKSKKKRNKNKKPKRADSASKMEVDTPTTSEKTSLENFELKNRKKPAERETSLRRKKSKVKINETGQNITRVVKPTEAQIQTSQVILEKMEAGKTVTSKDVRVGTLADEISL
jgi:hypothetical protein